MCSLFLCERFINVVCKGRDEEKNASLFFTIFSKVCSLCLVMITQLNFAMI